jgi:hypothetical protein
MNTRFLNPLSSISILACCLEVFLLWMTTTNQRRMIRASFLIFWSLHKTQVFWITCLLTFDINESSVEWPHCQKTSWHEYPGKFQMLMLSPILIHHWGVLTFDSPVQPSYVWSSNIMSCMEIHFLPALISGYLWVKHTAGNSPNSFTVIADDPEKYILTVMPELYGVLCRCMTDHHQSRMVPSQESRCQFWSSLTVLYAASTSRWTPERWKYLSRVAPVCLNIRRGRTFANIMNYSWMQHHPSIPLNSTPVNENPAWVHL